ncbi:MAG: endolytic transglycosylase MltG [Oscillospiraceae bacterium]|jgi:UPF0755 protein|nr:endolytic transglycosylase MltG [Oscillospiraceae bacterium]
MDETPHDTGARPEKKPFKLDIDFDAVELLGDATLSASDLHSTTPIPKAKGTTGTVSKTGALRPPVNKAQPYRVQTAQRPMSAASRKNKLMQTLASMSVVIAVVAACTLALSYFGISVMRDILAIGRENAKTDETTIVLEADLSTADVIHILKENKLIHQEALCNLYFDFLQFMKARNAGIKTSELKTPEYLSGTYVLTGNLGLEEMLDAFKGAPKTAETVSLTFPEGYTAGQIMEKVAKYKVQRADVLQSSMNTAAFNYAFLQGLDLSGRYFKYEGYLFPDTYQFYLEENSTSVVTKLMDNFQSKWSEEYAARAAELGFTVDDVITLASIIQKEAGNKEQMRDISGVLHNRLNNPADFPYLDCDSTRDYVTNNIATRMDDASAQYYYAIYNTYVCIGLPRGPICNPGTDAIEAALNPKKHDYYFFQHDKYKKLYLSETKTEHDKITYKLVSEGIAQ